LPRHHKLKNDRLEKIISLANNLWFKAAQSFRNSNRTSEENMSPSLSDRLIVDSTMMPEHGSEGIKVYRAKQSKQWRLGLIGLVLGLIGLLPLTKVIGWLGGGPVPDHDTIMASLCALFLPFGIFWIVSALRGLPRLTVTPEGISVDSALSRRWASWDSLDPFKVTTTHTGRFNQRFHIGSARVIGPNVSPVQLRGKNFAISDFFQTPMGALVPELNAARAAALGTSHPTLAAAPPPEFAVGLANFTAPWLTLAILALLIIVFAIENIFPVSPGNAGSPSVPTLLAMGGLSPAAVLEYGEWYRLFTAPLLHGGILHIVFNGLALFLGGRLLERLVGRLWFFAYFVVGALGGSLVSLAVNPANLVSVGASGALMGLFAALFVSAFHMPAHSPARQRIQVSSIQVLIPSLLPLASTSAVGQIDYGAHFGGAIAGALLAAILLKAWPQTEPLPRLRWLSAGILYLGVVLFAGSAGFAVINYPKYDVALIPPAEMPKTAADQQAQGASLVARYPKDPRSHLFLGQSLAASHDNAGAERELRTALAGAQAHPTMFGPQLEPISRGILAALLLDEGKRDEAKTIAQPLCAAPPGGQAVTNLRKLVHDQHLCE
jgi:rhomboid protease GluP